MPAAPLHPAQPDLLEVEALGVSFGKTPVVRDVSFSVARGETVGLVGESGSGKTTVGRAVLALLDSSIARVTGKVQFDGFNVLEARGPLLRDLRRQMQIVFQDPAGSLNPKLTIAQALTEPLRIHGFASTFDEALPIAQETLEKCGMPRHAVERYPHQFSGGQRQRIAIARALVLKPALVVCDEPTSALDVSVQAQILNLLMELRKSMGLSYLFISHDMGVINHMCDRVLVMAKGEVVESGPRESVLRSPSHPYTQKLLASVFSSRSPQGSEV